MNTDKPLVTISMLTYNQEKYVRDAVRSLLSQTYEPLEIVISDDCSTDRTWDIITEEIGKYKEAGGIHKNIVLNRNEKNLGIALHAQTLSAFVHGIISIGMGGDDISFPERVEQVYRAWHEDGRRAAIIINDAIKIDDCGKSIGRMSRRVLRGGAFGAGAAYVRQKKRYFGGIVEPRAYEDQVLSRRALLFGSILIIWKPLMYYRVGSGVSTITKNFRRCMITCLKAEVASWKQTLRDLRHVKNDLSEARFICLYNDAKLSYCRMRRQLWLWDGNSLKAKIRGVCAIPMRQLLGRSGVVAIVLLLPHSIGDVMLDGFVSVVAWGKKLIWQIIRR